MQCLPSSAFATRRRKGGFNQTPSFLGSVYQHARPIAIHQPFSSVPRSLGGKKKEDFLLSPLAHWHLQFMICRSGKKTSPPACLFCCTGEMRKRRSRRKRLEMFFRSAHFANNNILLPPPHALSGALCLSPPLIADEQTHTKHNRSSFAIPIRRIQTNVV